MIKKYYKVIICLILAVVFISFDIGLLFWFFVILTFVFWHKARQINGKQTVTKPSNSLKTKSWGSQHILLMCFLTLIGSVVIGVSIFLSGPSTNTPSSPTSNNSVNETSQPAMNRSVIELKSIRFYQEYGYTYAEGEVQNISSQPLKFVQATTDFRDSSGNLVTSKYSYLKVNNLLPGQTSSFENLTNTNPAFSLKKSTIKFIGRIGDSNDDIELLYKNSSSPVYQNNTNPKPVVQTVLTPDAVKTIIAGVVQSVYGVNSLDKITYDENGKFTVEATSSYSTADYIIQTMFEVIQAIASKMASNPSLANINPVMYLKSNTSTGNVVSTTTLETLKQVYNKQMAKGDWKSISNVNAVGL